VRDGCAELYSSIGQALSISDLANHMIVTSSNLATNLLIDVAGVAALQEKLADIGVRGVELRRGVEDELAFEHKIINRVTADGLLQLFSSLYGARSIDPDLSEKMLRILMNQKFNQGIPAGLPLEIRQQSRFAHKTGEISTVATTGLLEWTAGTQSFLSESPTASEKRYISIC